MVVILLPHINLAIKLLVLDPPQVLGQVMTLYRLLHTVNVVPLQEPRLRAVYVPGMEAIDPALEGRVFVPEFLVDGHQPLQVLTLRVDVNVHEAGLELLHFEGLNKVLEVLREVIVDFVLLQILLEEVLHHLIILIEEDPDVVMLAPVMVQELV